MGVAPLDYGPVLLRKPFGSRLAADTLPSGCPRRRNATVGPSPWLYPPFPASCPYRVHRGRTPQPTRRYPRLWIGRPSSGRPRDLNPPDQDAAQHTLRACPPPQTARPGPRGRPVGVSLPAEWGFPCCTSFPCIDMPSPLPRWDLWIESLAMKGSRPFGIHQRRRPSPSRGRVGSHVGTFGACSVFTHVTACRLAAPQDGTSVSKAPTASLPPPPLR
jgi:hypothetical protein